MLSRLRSLSLAVLVLAGCADDRGSSIILAAEGGSVTAADVSLSIPASSLATDTEVVLAESSLSDELPALEGAQSAILRIEPEGTVLELAATIQIQPGFIDGSAEASVAVHQLRAVDGPATWVRLESSRDATGAVTTSVTRFDPLAFVVTEPGTAGTIEGTLSWGDGTPVDGAPVELWLGDVMLTTSTTDAAGAFSFSDLEAGSYFVRIDYECTLEQGVSVAPGAPVELALTLCG